ncbi:type I secretion system permease/ATPase [Pseudothauera nasutitermitis]|uniref:Cyclolysin secretion/processing ATP-binding protein CyaB n=1 Tax=Pseudothauera nasutitermitis TaxID=2565930 RepID=A0A4S4ANC3_9RHOO|nr:type I secretion system permease/ATPase [Pseudothauera nasutitermitis]THF61145.1 type I secretion system permease/ATPase [Pseudothauera nasutitermitis]
MPHRQDLLDCLILVTRAHGGVLTRESALAGLPVDAAGLTPSLFGRAAQRAGMTSQVVVQPLDALNDALFPAILLLQGERACVLAGRDAERGVLRVVFPELGEAEVELPQAELAGRYTGRAIYLRPRFRFDARSPLVRPPRGEHWFWGVIAENRALYRDVLTAALLINLFALAMPLFVMNVYDRVVPNNATDTLWVLAAGVLLLLAGDLVLRTMRGHFVDLAGSRVDVKLSAHIMSRVLGLRMEARPASAGSFAANLRAFESVRDFISSATVVAFIDVPFAALFLVVIAWIAWPLVLPFLVGVAALLLYAMAVQGKMHELSETTYRAGAQRNATLIEGLVGMETVKALGAEAPIQRKWERSAALLARVGAQLRLLSASATNGAMWVQQTVSVVVIVIGVYLIGEGELSMGGLIACYMLSSRAMAPIGQVAGLLVQYHGAATALSSLDELMKQPVERPDGGTFISRPSFRGAIEFRDVSFSYPGQETQALRNVSLRIQPGERLAILGRVGSGKTTLEKLILGLYQPTGGSVLIDGADARQLDPAELRRSIGYVAQDVTLFYGTLRENIAMAAPLADDAAVLRAAETAGILDFVNNHPQGFDMLVGERGESLSGGQRQGVAIARALINDPPMLVLDEPTSSMDHSSEEDIKRRLGEYARGRTLIVVTHRTSLLDLVDRIVVIDGGRVVADGPKAQVVEALRQGRIGRAGA